MINCDECTFYESRLVLDKHVFSLAQQQVWVSITDKFETLYQRHESHYFVMKHNRWCFGSTSTGWSMRSEQQYCATEGDPR